MRMNNAEMMVSNIDDKYVWEAGQHIGRKRSISGNIMRKLGTMAACFVLFGVIFLSTLSVATAAGNIPAYDILCAVYPEMAQKLTPVNISCEDNGINMEVEAINVENNVAEIYISMTDLTGNRIDETTDLFDSCDIHISNDSIGTCSFVEYDETTNSARFLIYVEQMQGKKIEGKKLTFSVSKFLSGKKIMEEELPEIILDDVQSVTNVQKDVPIRGGANSEARDWNNVLGYLYPNEAQKITPTDGVDITAWGFVDNQLHVQVYYEDILNTDNHGEIYLIDSDGKKIEYSQNIAFWDEAQVGSYEEYIFDVSPDDDLSELSVWGYFNTCKNLTTGNWEVNVPIENIE